MKKFFLSICTVFLLVGVLFTAVRAEENQPYANIYEYNTINTVEKFGSNGSLGYVEFYSKTRVNINTGSISLYDYAATEVPKGGSAIDTVYQGSSFTSGVGYKVSWYYRAYVASTGATITSGIETHTH